jgi:hypothetical protein
MSSSISFNYKGLGFEAEVNFTPGCAPTFEDPGDNDEVEILSLKHDNNDASWMLKSDEIADELKEIAIEVCNDLKEQNRQEDELDRYIADHPEF